MKTVIEINGRKYDARTGVLLTSSLTPSANRPTNQSTASMQKSLSQPVIDGIRRNPARAVNNQSRLAKHTVKTPAAIKLADDSQHNMNSQAHRVKRLSSPAQSMQRNLEKSHTLLRAAVKKPFSKPQIHSTYAPAIHKTIKGENSPAAIAKFFKPVSKDRVEHAKQVEQSQVVSRFSSVRTLKPKLDKNLTITKPPQEKPETSPPPIPLALDSLDLDSKPKKQQVFRHSAPKNINQDKRTTKVARIRQLMSNVKYKPRVIGISAAAIALLLLVGFFAYQNIPAVAMRVAAQSAGFSGRLPDNIPSGFSFKGPIAASRGFISLNYQSNSDDRKFSITQKPTAWTSESLLTNYLIASKYRYQTYRDKGLTVFIYNEGSATWVDKGIWYSIAGEGALSSDQILAIAGSM